jgi:hypothetical protein
MAPWKLPLIVAGMAVPVALAFAFGGAAAGTAVGALVAAAIVAVAVRQRPRGPIGTRPAEDEARHVLIVLTCAVEEPGSIQRLLAAAGLDGGRAGADVLVLAPAKIGFLDRWASDVEGAREAAQRNLVASVAALAKAGVVAEARVGDEDVVQAVEDQLGSFAASEVVLVVEADGPDHSEAAAELESRLRVEFRRVEIGGG